MRAPLAASLAFLAAFMFCALASALYGWHSAVTGPAAAICAPGLIACAAWLNRSAGEGDEEDADATAEDELGYRDQLAELQRDDTTSSRARFILDQQKATLPDTPYNQGCIRATAGYIRALEASNAPDGAA